MNENTVIDYALSQSEIDHISESLEQLRVKMPDPQDPAAYDNDPFADVALPQGLSAFLASFRRAEKAAGAMVHGFPVNDIEVGPTPAHWNTEDETRASQDQELIIAWCAAELGDPFAWSSLQRGRMIQDLIPIAGDEERQNGHSSQTLLEFHTEDGFHPNRPDYLLLFGIRNHDQAPTVLASVRDIDLTDHDIEVLRQPYYAIRPDHEHIRQLEALHPDHPALSRMRELAEDPEPVPVIFGDPQRPYLRIDLPFMDCAEGGDSAKNALYNLMSELERVQQDVVVDQGTLLIVDNYLAVHGRKPFPVRYDGTDRWLKRMVVSRDLRKAATADTYRHSRVLF
ncbi:MAG: guanitoxin biosynthesis L-enduracididine beta-hydroxylase GntD [Actinomycetota bacterium]